MLCRENTDETARLGLAISKKQCRKATARNRIKRATREAFRQHQHKLKGLDIVVINQPAAALANNDVMNESLVHHFERCSTTKRKTNEQGS